MGTQSSGSASRTIFNFIASAFVIAAVLWLLFVMVRLAGNPIVEATPAVVFPTQVQLPTLTPSDTPTNTATATESLTPTITFTPSNTPPPTLPPSPTFPTATITDTPGPTPTPSDTPTPSVSPSFTPTETPTGPTPTFTQTTSPFPFALRENQVIYTRNFANSAGCAWQGVGGQAFGIDGRELRGMQIHVFSQDGSFDRTTPTGSNSLYGQDSGWEVVVDNIISNRIYFVQLRSSVGTPVSDRIEIRFPSDCEGNLALVRFIQERPF